MDADEIYRMLMGHNAASQHPGDYYPLTSDPPKFNSPRSEPLWINIPIMVAQQAPLNLLKHYPELVECCQGEELPKAICAKVFMKGETIVECFECRMEETCVICLECYQNGHHQGHKVMFQKVPMDNCGCCDCGDEEAWKSQGNCSKHSGEAQDVELDSEVISKFVGIIQDIFYMHYNLKITDKTNKVTKYFFKSLLHMCHQLISVGLRGIKLLALALTQPLRHSFNKQLQSSNLVQHCFNHKFTGAQLQEWQPLFIGLFPYYQFKKHLMSAYFTNYALVYSDKRGKQHGQSISFQILTSYKLLDEYISSNEGKPLGYGAEKEVENGRLMGRMIGSDIDKIVKMPEGVPERYCRMHINYGIGNLFTYYSLLKKRYHEQKQNYEAQRNKAIKKHQQPEYLFDDTRFLIQNDGFFHNQWVSMHTLLAILRTIKDDKAFIIKMLKQVTTLIIFDDKQASNLTNFCPYERAFSLILFFWLDFDLSKLTDKKSREVRNQLEMSLSEWDCFLEGIQNKMLKSYVFFGQVMSNHTRGYNSSLANYIEFYNRKDKLISNVDIIGLKMIALLSRQPHEINFPELINLDAWQVKQWNEVIFKTFMQQMHLLYLSHLPQIYVAYCEAKEDPKIYQLQIHHYLKALIVAHKGVISLTTVQQFCREFMFSNEQFLKRHMNQLCLFVKQRRAFELKEHCQVAPFPLEAFALRCNVTETPTESKDPRLVFQLLKDYNQTVFAHFWNEDSLFYIRAHIFSIYNQLEKEKVKETMLQFFENVCKLCFLLVNIDDEYEEYVEDLLHKMPLVFDFRQELKQYEEILGHSKKEESTDISANDLLDKKEALKEKKMKKLQMLKQKAEENLNKVKEKHEIQEEQELQQVNKEGLNVCAICRKPQSQEDALVYLAKLSYKNMAKLLWGGRGRHTLSLVSCYHVFDYECISKHSVAKGDSQVVFKCPICRKVGNIFLPLEPEKNTKKDFVGAALERIVHVIMSDYNFKQIDPVLQLVKSFYHYCLLAKYEPQYTKNSRKKLYQLLLKILAYHKLAPSITKKAMSVLDHAFPVKPEPLVQLNAKSEADRQFLESLEPTLAKEYEMILLMEKQNPVYQPEARAPKESSPKQNQDFYYVMMRVLLQVRKLSQQSGKELALQLPGQGFFFSLLEKQLKPANPHPLTDSTLNQLFAYSPNDSQPSHHPEFSLINLPLTYNFDISRSHCPYCNTVSTNLVICLLCRWMGCVRCKTGGIYRHYKAHHGEVCAAMRINDAQAYLFFQGEVQKVGSLYLSEWGEPIDLKKNWKDYVLQKDVLRAATERLLREE